MKTEIDITTYAPLEMAPLPRPCDESRYKIDGGNGPMIVWLDETGQNLVISLSDRSKRVVDVLGLANSLSDASRNTVPIDELFKRGWELQASLPAMDDKSAKRMSELKEMQEVVDDEIELIQAQYENVKRPIQKDIDEVKSEIRERLGGHSPYGHPGHGQTTKYGNARNYGKRTTVSYDWKVVDLVTEMLDGDRPKLAKLLANARKETINDGDMVVTFNEV